VHDARQRATYVLVLVEDVEGVDGTHGGLLDVEQRLQPSRFSGNVSGNGGR